MKTIGLVGVRGHTGRELVRLVDQRDDLEIAYASSRSLLGEPLRHLAPEVTSEVRIETLDEAEVGQREVDAIILAMPNDQAEGYVTEIEKHQADTLVVDLSADYRLDHDWLYGLPEIYGRDSHTSSRRISNPGCYATAAQLCIHPVRELLSGPAHVFGVSGYSGAGTMPSRRNDPAALSDNLMPYGLVAHGHEQEMSAHLGQQVRFTPHVAEFFRGLTTTVHLEFAQALTQSDLTDRFEAAYGQEHLIDLRNDPVPEIRDGASRQGALIGGFQVSEDGHHAVVVCAIDNLLKGAAVQALQNLTLALGLPEYGSD